MKMFSEKSNKLLLAALILLAALLLSIDVHKKFIGHHDWNGVWYGVIARNFIRYGLIETRLASIGGNNSTFPNDAKQFFTHYPPLFPIILATSYKLFGQSEFSLRFVTLLFSLSLVAGIYLVGFELFDSDTGFLAAIFTVSTPFFIYFGTLPVHETILLPIIIGSFYFYIRWLKTSRSVFSKCMLFFIILGLLITWPAYFVPFLIVGHYLFSVKKRVGKLIFIGLLPFLFFGLHLMHVKLLTGLFLGGGLVGIFTSRISSIQTNAIYQASLLKMILTEFHYLIIYFTSILTGLSCFWLVFIFTRRITNKKPISFSSSIVLLLGLFGILYVSIFREAAFLHDYLIYYLMPFVVLAAASMVLILLRKLRIQSVAYILILIVILAVAFERRPFAKALLESNQSEKGFLISSFINQHSQPTDKVFIGSNFYSSFFGPFIVYYTNRTITYGEELETTTAAQYDLIVRPKAHDILDREAKIYLNNNYPRFESKDYIWYTPHHLAVETR